MTYEKWKAYYDLAGKHPVVADLEHNVLFALGDWIDDHNVLTTRLEAAEATCQSLREQSSRWEAQALEAGVRIAELEAQVEAAREVLEVADLRGDTDLPYPANDPKLWSARMQDAWDALRAALQPEKPQEVKP